MSDAQIELLADEFKRLHRRYPEISLAVVSHSTPFEFDDMGYETTKYHIDWSKIFSGMLCHYPQSVNWYFVANYLVVSGVICRGFYFDWELSLGETVDKLHKKLAQGNPDYTLRIVGIVVGTNPEWIKWLGSILKRMKNDNSATSSVNDEPPLLLPASAVEDRRKTNPEWIKWFGSVLKQMEDDYLAPKSFFDEPPLYLPASAVKDGHEINPEWIKWLASILKGMENASSAITSVDDEPPFERPALVGKPKLHPSQCDILAEDPLATSQRYSAISRFHQLANRATKLLELPQTTRPWPRVYPEDSWIEFLFRSMSPEKLQMGDGWRCIKLPMGIFACSADVLLGASVGEIAKDLTEHDDEDPRDPLPPPITAGEERYKFAKSFFDHALPDGEEPSKNLREQCRNAYIEETGKDVSQPAWRQSIREFKKLKNIVDRV